MTHERPAVRPVNPHFSSGPCAKRPGWSLENLKEAVVGRSHRSSLGKARLQLAIDLSIAGAPGCYVLASAEVAVPLAPPMNGTSSLTLAHRITSADGGRLYSDASVVMVWVDPASGRPVPLPTAVCAACSG